jgi:ATP adenylyltransferase
MREVVGVFQRGTLWNRIVSISQRARVAGALQPFETSLETILDREIPFAVRRIEKMPAKPLPDTYGRSSDRPNPFLPHDPAMLVGRASPTHICLLNKYNVFPHHLLIVTDYFEHQETELTRADFAALWRCMREFDGLGFYNSGVRAGASQPHKHLQLVPLPIGEPKSPDVPIEALLNPERHPIDRVLCLEELPFDHAMVRWDPFAADSTERMAGKMHGLYLEMLARLRIERPCAPDVKLPAAYNLLVRPTWMLLVPRGQEDFQGISLNALAFAGALLVRDAQQLAALKAVGPLAALTAVARTELA